MATGKLDEFEKYDWQPYEKPKLPVELVKEMDDKEKEEYYREYIKAIDEDELDRC
jgi:hypothetical protein